MHMDGYEKLEVRENKFYPRIYLAKEKRQWYNGLN
jgi:hypothetical protein